MGSVRLCFNVGTGGYGPLPQELSFPSFLPQGDGERLTFIVYQLTNML